MKFARWTFWISGAYGLVVLAPLYFMENRLAEDMPPPIAHPEYFYGFVGVALAWQVAFLFIGADPVRYRPLMLPSMFEKASYVAAASALYFQGRLPDPLLLTLFADLVWGLMFLAAWLKTGGAAHNGSAAP